METRSGQTDGAVSGKRILVTGGRGLLGRDIGDVLGPTNVVLSTDVGQCDVLRPGEIRSVAEAFRPDIVIHCAAYTGVDRAESEEAAATALNADGTSNVARVCRERGILLVTYGSDYVFDGKSGRPYEEDDPPAPLSAYGRSKLAAEVVLREGDAEYLLIRSQWLFGPHGRCFIRTILEKAGKGEALRVVNDQIGCPTSGKDLARATALLVRAGARGTYHFSNEGETSWHGLAAFVLAQRLPERASLLHPVATKDATYPAPRPAYSVLHKGKYVRTTGDRPRTWQDAVVDLLSVIERS